MKTSGMILLVLLALLPTADAANPLLYYGANGSICRVNADGSGQATVVSPSQAGWAIGQWVIDEVNQRIYSAEEPTSGFGNSRIFSTAMDGTDRKTVFGGSGLGMTNYGMAVDAAQGYVFLHSHNAAPVGPGPNYNGRIQRVTISNGELALLPQNVWYARLDVDPQASQLYYTDMTGFSSGGPSIYNLNGLKRSNYDGTSIQSISISGQVPALEMVISTDTSKVFFGAHDGGIYSASLTGGAASSVAPTVGKFWLDYDPQNAKLYWLDSNGIHRASADGSAAVLVADSNLLGLNLSKIQAVPVPEPSTYTMALAGLAFGGFSMWRRRKRA